MRSWMMAFSLGVFLGGYIPWLPDHPYHFILLLPGLVSLRKQNIRLFGAYCFGLFWILNWAFNSTNNLLPSELEKQDIWVRGEISELPRQGERNISFEFKVTHLCSDGDFHYCSTQGMRPIDRNIRLSVYSQNRFVMEPGQVWLFKVRLKRPHGFSNPGGFDYEAWLWQRNISASGYVRENPNNSFLDQRRWSFVYLRFAFRQSLDRYFADNAENLSDSAGLIKALTIGDHDELSDTEWDLFTATGTNHLVVISGLHVGLLAGLVYRMMSWLLSIVTPLSHVVAAKRSGAFFAVMAAFFYTGLAGFSLPAQRAFIMVAVFMMGQLFCRNTSVYNSFILALGIVLLLDPLAPQNNGFWMSFCAVAVLIYFVNGRYEQSLTLFEKMGVLLKTQMIIFIGLLPIMLLFFQQVSLLAPLINLVAIPYVSLLVVPLCLVALSVSWISTSLAEVLYRVLDILLDWFIRGLELCVAFSPVTVLQLPALPLLLWVVLVAAVMLFLISTFTAYTRMLQIFAVLGLLVFAFKREISLEPGEYNIRILDVGQGLAVHVSTQNHHLIYDAGPNYSRRLNAGEDVLLPYLRAQNVRKIDRIIISHEDNDHAGGLGPLLLAYPTAELLASHFKELPEHGKETDCRSGQQWEWDGVTFTILHPDDRFYSSNNSSCVLKISNHRYSTLIPGDIERRVEGELLARYRRELEADILIAPHHGSKTSSSEAFVEIVDPQYVIFSAGYLNQFNHPHPDVVKRYTNSDTLRITTADSGAVNFTVGVETDLVPMGYRYTHKRFWRLAE